MIEAILEWALDTVRNRRLHCERREREIAVLIHNQVAAVASNDIGRGDPVSVADGVATSLVVRGQA